MIFIELEIKKKQASYQLEKKDNLFIIYYILAGEKTVQFEGDAKELLDFYKCLINNAYLFYEKKYTTKHYITTSLKTNYIMSINKYDYGYICYLTIFGEVKNYMWFNKDKINQIFELLTLNLNLFLEE